MINKRILFQSKFDECSVEKISPEFQDSNNYLEKLASGRLSDEIKDFIQNKIEKDPQFLYVLVSALGAGEIWGPNINGDYFEENEIIKSYKTFEEYGYVFPHHKNKDPKNSIGEIMFSHWNSRMHRVELITKLNREKAPRITRDIDDGKMWDVSMGCKVPYDVCSICNHKAKTKNDYCEHIKNHKGEVLPDGRQVYMKNKYPRFFDISFVYIGADRTAKSLMKIASSFNIPLDLLTKKSDIDKEIKGKIISKDAGHMARILMQEFEQIKPYEKNISNDVLSGLSSKPISDILTTLLVLGIVLKPHEFQRIALHKIGENPDKYEKRGLIFDPQIPLPERRSSTNKFNPFDGEIDYDIFNKIIPFIEHRSALKQYLYPRLIKFASSNNLKQNDPERRRFPSHKLAVPGILGASYIYKKYLDNVPKFNAEGLDKSVKKNPWLLPILASGSIGAVKGVSTSKNIANERRKRKPLEKIAGNLGGRMFVGVPAAYLASNIASRFDHDESKILNFIQNHPNLLAMLGIAATNSTDDWKAIAKAISEMTDETNSLLTKTAASIISPKKSTSDLIKDVDKLYNKYNNMDKKYDRIKNISNIGLMFQDPSAMLGRGADMLAGSALNKIVSKIN